MQKSNLAVSQMVGMVLTRTLGGEHLATIGQKSKPPYVEARRFGEQIYIKVFLPEKEEK